MTPLKLHLGCGLRKIHGFVNVDALSSVNPDLVEDVFTLPSFSNGSVDLIYASHVLEHSKRGTFEDVLSRWFDVLKSGGVLRVAVPDIEAAARWLVCTGRLRDVLGLLYGGQSNEFDHHGIGWDEKTLTEDLVRVGFIDVHRYDWRETEHFHVDDFSNAMLPDITYFTRMPHGVIKGVSVSLNMEATKP